MKLDPLYCDVVVQRWQAFAGGTAVLAATGEDFATVQSRRASKPASTLTATSRGMDDERR